MSRRAPLAIAALLPILAFPPTPADPPCTPRHVHIGDYPVGVRTVWSDEAQGITHDGRHWFLATRRALLKVPVSADLAAPLDGHAGVLRAELPDALAARGFDHFGDISWYAHAGTGVVCVPVDGGPAAELAFFRAADLAYLGSAPLPGAPPNAPFCAIDARGHLFVGRRLDSMLPRFRVDWSAVLRAQAFALERLPPFALLDERGAPLRLDDLQGAAFSEDGRRLYMISGFLDDHACPIWSRGFWSGDCPADAAFGGIHVLEVRGSDGGPCSLAQTCEARRIDKSTNPGAGPGAASRFTYAYRGTLLEAEEPEGITVWDLEAPGAPVAPGVRGQVHALLLDNELPSRLDRVSIRHYRVERRCAEGAGSGELRR
jgi:hypothetical protein